MRAAEKVSLRPTSAAICGVESSGSVVMEDLRKLAGGRLKPHFWPFFVAIPLITAVCEGADLGLARLTQIQDDHCIR